MIVASSGSVASPFQSSLSGVLAVGNVRGGSVKPVTSVVGEGSVVVQAVHASLTKRAGASFEHALLP